MRNASVERVHCISLRTHKNDLVEEVDNEAKAYRSLLYLYAEHLNAFIKGNRDCLADIDYHPRQKMSRQDQLAIQQNMDKICLKNYDRMSREGISRNCLARKSYEEFTRHYQEVFPAVILENVQGTTDSKMIENIEWDKSPMARAQSGKKLAIASNTAGVRPLTSKGTSRNRPNGCSTQTNTCKMKSVSAYASTNPEAKADGDFPASITRQWSRQYSKNTKHLFFQSVKKGEDDCKEGTLEEQFVFNGSEILIKEHKRYPSTIFKERKTVGTQKVGMKKMLTMKFAQRKSINEIEKMQIQNRIMMVSSALAVNPTTSQGYRPKSRCWQNYFN